MRVRVIFDNVLGLEWLWSDPAVAGVTDGVGVVGVAVAGVGVCWCSWEENCYKKIIGGYAAAYMGIP